MLTDTRTQLSVLVVSRDPCVLLQLNADGKNSWQLEIADSGWQALERAQAHEAPGLILLDLGENAADGLHTLRWLRRVRPDVPIVLISQSEDGLQRTEALQLGAKDYLVKPLQEKELQQIMGRHLGSSWRAEEFQVSSENIEEVSDDMFFVWASPAMRELRAQSELLAQVDAPLLIVGESDTGKQIAARLIHKLSVRSGFQFLNINCSAMPEDLLEAELFGKDRAVVAGVSRSIPGKFDLCGKGTIYFDEITDVPLRLQEKLVRMLQERHFSRVGGEARVEADFRIVAATRMNIEEALAEGRLREDLYFRLSAFTVYLPPLKQRKEDISLLLGHFMNRLSRHYGLPARTFPPDVLYACQCYCWPGNLEELESFVKRYLVVGDDELALTELKRKSATVPEERSSSLRLQLEPPRTSKAHEAEENGHGLKSLVQTVKGETERNAIANALEQTHWNRKAASRMLQVSYRTLLYKIQQYHLTPPAAYLPAATVLPVQGIKK